MKVFVCVSVYVREIHHSSSLVLFVEAAELLFRRQSSSRPLYLYSEGKRIQLSTCNSASHPPHKSSLLTDQVF